MGEAEERCPCGRERSRAFLRTYGVTIGCLRCASIPRASGSSRVSNPDAATGRPRGVSSLLTDSRALPVGWRCAVGSMRAGFPVPSTPWYREVSGQPHSFCMRSEFPVIRGQSSTAAHGPGSRGREGGPLLQPPPNPCGPPCPPMTRVQASRWGQGKESQESRGLWLSDGPGRRLWDGHAPNMSSSVPWRPVHCPTAPSHSWSADPSSVTMVTHRHLLSANLPGFQRL